MNITKVAKVSSKEGHSGYSSFEGIWNDYKDDGNLPWSYEEFKGSYVRDDSLEERDVPRRELTRGPTINLIDWQGSPEGTRYYENKAPSYKYKGGIMGTL